jgi:hypothetical protein
MAKLRYVPDANEAYELEALLRQNLGFTFNPIAVEGLLSRWTKAQIVEAVQIVYVKSTMGCDALLAATEAYLDKLHP